MNTVSPKDLAGINMCGQDAERVEDPRGVPLHMGAAQRVDAAIRDRLGPASALATFALIWWKAEGGCALRAVELADLQQAAQSLSQHVSQASCNPHPTRSRPRLFSAAYQDAL